MSEANAERRAGAGEFCSLLCLARAAYQAAMAYNMPGHLQGKTQTRKIKGMLCAVHIAALTAKPLRASIV